jgi:ankyrin repeat protein
MNKYPIKKINNFLPDILINEESKDKLFSFAFSHNLFELEEYITTHSISLNVTNNNNQTIMHAILQGESTTDEEELLRCIKFLVERGAPISSIDRFYLTPLFICIKKNYPLIFKYLLEQGASLDINTYDNLTVLHLLSHPDHITHDDNGIKNLIPEKLPKFDIEKYKEVYTKIDNAIFSNIKLPTNTAIILNTGLEKFKIIASQFYYDNNGNEDFQNILLIEDYKNKINETELKNDMFKKIKDQLKDFYDDDTEITKYDLEQELNDKLDNIKLDLNSNIKKMQGYNDDVLKAIEILALSLELSIHFFFLEDPANTYIATDVAIAIAEKANGNNIVGALVNNNIRPTVNAGLYVTTVPNTTQEIINEIINIAVQNAAVFNAGTPAAIAGVINGLGQPPGLPNALLPLFLSIRQGAITVANPIQLPPLIQVVDGALGTAGAGPAPLVTILGGAGGPGAPAGPNIQTNIQNAANIAATVVTNVATVETYIKDALTVVPVNPAVNILQVLAVLQAATQAAVYAAVYAQNKILVPQTVANLQAVHAAVDTAVDAGVLAGAAGVLAGAGIQVSNQEVLQRALTDPIVAIEVAVRSASEAVQAAARAAPVNTDVVITAVKEALENIDVNKQSIDTIIAIAKQAATVAAGAGGNAAAQISDIVRTLTNINVVREAVLAVEAAVKAAVKADGTNNKIVVKIRNLAVNAAIRAGAMPGEVNTAITIPGIITLIPQTAETIITKIVTEVKTALDDAVATAPPLIAVVDGALISAIPAGAPGPLAAIPGGPGAPAGPTIQTNIQNAANTAATVVTNVATVETYIRDAITVVPVVNILQVLAVLQAATRAAVYAAVYARNKILPPQTVANLPAVYAAFDVGVLAAVRSGVQASAVVGAGVKALNQEELQRALQNVLKDQVVAVEAVVRAVEEAVQAATRAAGAGGAVGAIAPNELQIIQEAVREALRLPPIIPEKLKNDDYNNLIKSYKLMYIPQKYINYNNNISNTYYDTYTEDNIKQASKIIKYKLPKGNRSYAIDYFNLLYTFNEYVRNNYIQKTDINNIFDLYQCIQQIYKYNYIIYIFEKEKDKILGLKNNYTTNLNTVLKKAIEELFVGHYSELDKSVSTISETLKKIEILANEYIDIYNKKNGLKVYENLEAGNIEIGIYPKIKFPTEIKHKLGDENAIIAKCNNYITYNNNKNDFFHNFVLYFQDIGVYGDAAAVTASTNAARVAGTQISLLNKIPIPINYDINIDTTPYRYITDDKNKAYKLYFYDSRYLKLEKQKTIDILLKDPAISNIKIPKYDNFDTILSKKFNDKLKTEYLHKILEEEFNKILVIQINNFFKEFFLKDKGEITYNPKINEPDYNKILLSSLGFKHILIPNYEFTNNKFLSISKNKNNFLKLTLFFDTNYFKQTIKSLKYYKKNEFITEILTNNRSLLLKTDIKGWTPIYYAIDGNNYQVINEILQDDYNKNTLSHYDHKGISPLILCINKQLNHLNYLLTEKNEIHYLNNYIKMLKNELKSNEISIPLNIESVFIIALFIQNHIWLDKTTNIDLSNLLSKNTRRTQINKKYNKINTTKSDVENNDFNFGDNKVVNAMDKPNRDYTEYKNKKYNYKDKNSDDNNIFKKYYNKAKQLERQDFGLYGSYWNNYEKKNFESNKTKILEHITLSKDFKQILEEIKLIEKPTKKFNFPSYNKTDIETKITKLNKINNKLEHYLKFINIRFNTNKDNTYEVFLNKIYVHVLANIIGVDLYLRMEELIINHYINSGVILDHDISNNNNNNIGKQLLNLNRFLINNNLDDTNMNHLYITKENPESFLKDKIKEILQTIFLPDDIEIINIFETVILPKYRDLYKITYKYLQMFILNYHKFIYNQYHGLEILLLLLGKL